MKLRSAVAAVVSVLAGTVLAAAPAQATGGQPPLVRCEFTPTPENPAARPVLRPLPFALTVGRPRVTFKTNYGPIVIEMNSAGAAPCAVHNMVSLVVQRFYNNSQCFRLTNSARLGVLQCGDLIEVEKGGPGYKFPDEVTGQETYPRGTVAMGNQGPGTNGSEFFIVHSFANIPPNYSVFGRVIRGMDALDRMVAAGIIPSERGPLDGLPAKPVKIERVTLSR